MPEKGIALPHGSSDRIEDIIGALGISQHDIPFESIDGKPARLVILLVLPRQNFQGHVRTLAGIAHVLSNDVLREALIAAPTPEAVIELIEEEEDKEVFDPYRA